MNGPADAHPPTSITLSNCSELASGTSSARAAAGPGAHNVVPGKIPSIARIPIIVEIACLIRIKAPSSRSDYQGIRLRVQCTRRRFCKDVAMR
jgi:hypothetical protein